jgi:hypothetical protein
MVFKNAILILGYNNTRINDVRKIREKAMHYLDAVTVLCKKSPTEDDKKAADYVIDVALENTPKNIEVVFNAIKEYSLNVIGLLPFSDPGTQLGAGLSKELNLKGSDENKVVAALDKYIFRQSEENAIDLPQGYRIIHSEQITSLKQLEKLHKVHQGNLFLKPSKEGNSRGCIDLRTQSNINDAWREIEKYVADGVVAEELVINADEYSWDHVNGYSWVTEKKTTMNEYRAEIQQIVPAPLPQEAETMLKNAGQFMGDISGYNGGACHNEIFYLKKSNEVLGVEPNLRPAGMRIWDLASLAFDDFDPWKEWLYWAARRSTVNNDHCLKQNYYAGIRMIQSDRTGALKSIHLKEARQYSTHEIECIEIVWTKKQGDLISSTIKDNADFIGYVIARAKNYEHLSNFLEQQSRDLLMEIEIV